MLEGYDRGITAFAIGLLAAGGYGILWAIAEKVILHTQHGPGIGGLPKGLEAIALSLATTLPLTFIPWLWQFFTSTRILFPGHFQACAAMIVAAGLGHIILYGTKKPPVKGIRFILFPPEMEFPDWWTATRMEFVYALVHFFSTVFVYQIVLHLADLSLPMIWNAFVKTIASGLIFFFGAATTVTVIRMGDPKRLTNPSWVGVRGITNGIILMIALTFGILM
jgi:hypothetical protein